MPPALRLGDMVQIAACAHGCPACPHPGIGPLIVGSPNVNINKRPAGRFLDRGMTNFMKQGSGTVFINNKAAMRMGDPTIHCGGNGQVVQGSNDVIVGG